MSTSDKVRELICRLGRQMYERGYVAANDGNITVKLSASEILATPTGVSKGFMEPSDLVLLDEEGAVKAGTQLPSSELKMHLEVYRRRPDIRAVVHAHPPYATAFAVAGLPLPFCAMAESICSLGVVPLVPYATPSTYEVPAMLASYLDKAEVFLLANHGALTLGRDLLQAYYRLEILENYAHIIFVAQQLGRVKLLSEEQVAKLFTLQKQKYDRNLACGLCSFCQKAT